MRKGGSIRGSNVGAGGVDEDSRIPLAPRMVMSYWCDDGHETRPSFAVSSQVVVPETWDCGQCGLPAGQNREAPPEAPRTEPYKTHLAYVKERRSDAEGEALLDEALAQLRARRGGPRRR